MGERVHAMFMALGLRHLLVVSEHSWPIGMITRQDLDVAAGPGGYWRRNRVGHRSADPLGQARECLCFGLCWLRVGS